MFVSINFCFATLIAHSWAASMQMSLKHGILMNEIISGLRSIYGCWLNGLASLFVPGWSAIIKNNFTAPVTQGLLFTLLMYDLQHGVTQSQLSYNIRDYLNWKGRDRIRSQCS